MNIFLKIIKINIPDANMSAFFENSKHFEFKKEKYGFLYNLFNEHKVTAYFKTDKNGLNSINFVMGSIDESIYHELLHMASTRIKGAFYFTGFMQSKSGEKPFTIGRGLNEGYTDVLTERYFALYGAKTGGYALGSRISLLIELIVGKKNMEKWYFESDLYSLTRSLEKYLPYDEIISLLKKTDIIVNHAGVSGYGSVVKRMYNEVMRSFAEVAIRKISEEYDDSDIEQKISKMFLKSKLMVLLNNPVVSFGRVYKVYNDTEILDVLSKYMVYGNI